MKRRNFLKLTSWLTLFGSTALVAKDSLLDKKPTKILAFGGDLDAAKRIYESVYMRTTEDIDRNDPEKATKYISSLYRSSRKAIGVPQEVTFQGFHSKPIPYIISGEGKTKEEAWERFWLDLSLKTWPYADSSPKKDIFWRRVVEEQSIIEHDFDWKRNLEKHANWEFDKYVVSCRFSLGDFT